MYNEIQNTTRGAGESTSGAHLCARSSAHNCSSRVITSRNGAPLSHREKWSSRGDYYSRTATGVTRGDDRYPRGLTIKKCSREIAVEIRADITRVCFARPSAGLPVTTGATVTSSSLG